MARRCTDIAKLRIFDAETFAGFNTYTFLSSNKRDTAKIRRCGGGGIEETKYKPLSHDHRRSFVQGISPVCYPCLPISSIL